MTKTPFTFYLDWIACAQFAGLFWAKENGLYDAGGLEVTIVPWHDDGRSVHEKVMHMAAQGQLCAGCSEDNLIITQAGKGRSVLAFGAMLQETPLVIMSKPEQKIRCFGDLRGKRIGMHADGIRALELVLALEGISVGDLDLHEVGFDLAHLREDRFDALQGYAMTEPVQLAALGVEVELLTVKHPRLHLYAQVYFSERTLIVEHQAIMSSFLTASNAGWLAVCAEPDLAAHLLAQVMVEPAQERMQREMLTRVIPLVTGGKPVNQIGTIDSEQWERNLATYSEFGLLADPLDLSDVVFDL
jgi:NitT/TauT family transport system substrate-binding protein